MGIWFRLKCVELLGMTDRFRLFNPRRGLFVLSKIDEILSWEQRKEAETPASSNSEDICAKSVPGQ